MLVFGGLEHTVELKTMVKQ